MSPQNLKPGARMGALLGSLWHGLSHIHGPHALSNPYFSITRVFPEYPPPGRMSRGHSTTPMGFPKNLKPGARVAWRCYVVFGTDFRTLTEVQLHCVSTGCGHSGKTLATEIPGGNGVKSPCQMPPSSATPLDPKAYVSPRGTKLTYAHRWPPCTFKPLFLDNKSFPRVPPPRVACPWGPSKTPMGSHRILGLGLELRGAAGWPLARTLDTLTLRDLGRFSQNANIHFWGWAHSATVTSNTLLSRPDLKPLGLAPRGTKLTFAH